MPNMTGLSVCETLRSTLLEKYLYIILVTSRNLVRDKVQAIAAGADDFLVKPLLAGELLSRLQAGTRILEQQQQLQELSTHDPLTGLLNRRMLFRDFGAGMEPLAAGGILAFLRDDRRRSLQADQRSMRTPARR